METMDWSHQRVLVTGAGGFIGSHLTARLVEAGARVRALVEYNPDNSWGWLDCSEFKNDLEVSLGDVRDRDSILKAVGGVDIVFHLAALIAIPYSYQAPLSYVRTNVEGTLNVLQAAQDAGVTRFVHTSTSEVYGTAQHIPIDEDHRLQGQSPYAASKIGADKIAEAFHRSFGLSVVTIRPFNTYGPRQSARAVIPTIITQALTESQVRLGNTTPTRDFTYVTDTVEAFVKLAGCREAIGRVVNVGTGKEVSISEVAQRILRLMGKSVPVALDENRVRPEAGEVDRLCADNTKARELAGWSPAYSLEEGLLKTIAWFQENVGRYKPGVYTI